MDLCSSSCKPWRKILYEKQNFPDNYVDESFLKDIQKNLHVKYCSTSEAIAASTVVSMEICSVVVFAVTYLYMETERVKAKDLFIGSSLITCFLYFLCTFTVKPQKNLNQIKSVIVRDFRSTGIFILFGFCLAPILKTLTRTVSTDTIYAMSALMFLLHLVCHDYGTPGAFVSSTLSLSSSLFSAVCLASRLGSVEDAFVLLTFSVEVFTLFPIFRRQLQALPSAWFAVTAALLLLSSYILLEISLVCFILFMLLILFVNIACPVWFVRWQKYKENLYGPWDEAVIES